MMFSVDYAVYTGVTVTSNSFHLLTVQPMHERGIQRLCSYDLMALYKSVYYYYYL